MLISLGGILSYFSNSYLIISNLLSILKQSKIVKSNIIKTIFRMEPQQTTNIIPDAFLCPISQQLMCDPVMAADGHTYQRKSIEQWLGRKHTTSPMTGQPLKHLELTENFAIKKAIEEFKVTFAKKKQGKSKGFAYSANDPQEDISSQYKAKIKHLEKQLEEQKLRKHISTIDKPEKSWQDSLPGFFACFGKKRKILRLSNSQADLEAIAEREGWNLISEWIASAVNLKHMENLFLYGKKMKKIEGINCLTGLLRLGLHNNQIVKIQNLNRLTSLVFLSLGFNLIERIENLEELTNLQQLDLYRNKISRIQNLYSLQKLKKLFISKNPAIERIGIMGLFEKINQEPGLIDSLRKRGVSITISILY